MCVKHESPLVRSVALSGLTASFVKIRFSVNSQRSTLACLSVEEKAGCGGNFLLCKENWLPQKCFAKNYPHTPHINTQTH